MEKWRTEKLEKIKNIELIMGQSPPSSSFNENSEGLPFLQGNADFGSIYPTISKYTTNPIKIALEDDILLSVRAPVGDINLAPFKLCIGRGLAAIRIKENSNIFYFYWFQKIKNILENLGIGSTFKAITKNELKRLAIPIPPLSEQQKIAEILRTVDEAIQKVDETIEKTKRLKQGLMNELLTKGIGHKEFKDSEIGRIPKEWRVIKLDDLSLNLIGGGTPSTSNPAFWDGTIPWMTSAYINRRLVTKGQRNITEEGLKNSATNLIPKENLLITTRVGIGKVAINVIDMAISQDLTGIIVDKTKSTPDFLYWFFISIENKLKGLAQGSTIKGILREELGRLKVTLPSLSEQQKIAEILTTVDLKIEIEEKRRERLERIKKGLMEELLTGKKRVSVG